MTEIVKRICEFSKEYNRLMGLFCKITPTALETVVDWKECTPDEEDCIGQHYYPVNVTEPCNTGGDLNIDGVVFPNSKEVEEKVNMFYKDCDTLILNEKDSLLRKLCKGFSWYSLYPNEEQLKKAAMPNELYILDLLLNVWRTASGYAEYSSFIDSLTERRKVLLSQKKESSHDMESANVSKQDNSKQERTDNESGINEQGKIIYPSGLDTERAIELLRKVQEKGLCDDRYDWKRSKTLFAYFASKASDTLGLSNRMAGERKAVSWKPFETLFTIKGKHINGLAQALKDLEKVGEVKGQKDIDSLF